MHSTSRIRVERKTGFELPFTFNLGRYAEGDPDQPRLAPPGGVREQRAMVIPQAAGGAAADDPQKKEAWRKHMPLSVVVGGADKGEHPPKYSGEWGWGR